MKKKVIDPIEEPLISKSQLKREMEVLKDLGRKIYAMPAKKRNALPLSPRLINAFEEAKRITSKEALRRHFQYVGKVLRDSDVPAIEEAIETIERAPQAKAHRLAKLKALWLQLIQGVDSPIEPLMSEHPTADRQKLRQLIRNARKEFKPEIPPSVKTGHAKKLFDYLKEITQLK